MNDARVMDDPVAAEWFAELAGIATSEASGTDRQLALVERSAREGEMAPLHRRDEDESYRVVAGEVTFYVGGDVIEAGPGDVVVAPAGVPRTHCAEADGSRWLVLTRVRSLPRYVDFGRAVSPLRCAWPSLAELAALESIAEANDIEILGPPGRLPAGDGC